MRSPAAPLTSSPPTCYEGTFPGYTDQARTVRGALAGWLALAACPAAMIHDAKVVASELAANAVLHSASRGASFTVRCEVGAGCVRIEVEDLGGPWRPRRPDDRPHGLDLIAALAGSGNWGHEPAGDGGPCRMGTASMEAAVSGSPELGAWLRQQREERFWPGPRWPGG